MWLFVHKKDGDPEKREANSVFWKDSLEEGWSGGLEVKGHLYPLQRPKLTGD